MIVGDLHDRNAKLARGLEIFGDIFALNILFIIGCIPIITIGASLTALYSMMLKILENEECTIARGFFEAFKANFKKATAAWMIIIFALIAVWGQWLYINNFQGAMASVYMVLGVVECAVIVLVLPFLFPLIAKFENTLWNTFKNAFLLSVSNLGSWLKISLAWFAPIFLSLYYPVIILSTWYLWLLILFGLIAYGTSHTVRKVFDRVADTQEKNEEKEKNKAEEMRRKAGIREKAMLGNTAENSRTDAAKAEAGEAE